MNHYDIDNLGNKIRLIYRKNDQVMRILTIKLGDSLTIQPDNPKKMKNRGRQCTIEGFHKDDIGYPIQAIVKFNDTNKIGKVDLIDLVAN